MTWLSDPELPAALQAANAQPDPDSLAAAERLRRLFPPALAAAALTQVGLRRAARTKFGPAADQLWFTRTGLEQATRPEVAAVRAERFVAAGARHVVDLGCGLGTDAAAFASAGLRVTAVEADPETAALAAANLARFGDRVDVVPGDAVALAPELLTDPAAAVFVDPARRTAAGRSWRVEDLSPPWPFVVGLLRSGRTVGVKAAPGLPYRVIPDEAEAEWVSAGGDVVEVALWSAPDSVPGRRGATRLPGGHRLVAAVPEPPLPTSAPQSYVFEPDGAAIRAGAVGSLGAELGLARLDPRVAYLTGDEPVVSPWLTGFAVREVLPYAEKSLRAWARERGIGSLEIKLRGVDVDPAVLRRRLRPRGSAAATLLLSPTPSGLRALVVQRMSRPRQS